MELTIATPPGFNFHRTVLSHGWCALPPFELDKNSWVLTRVLEDTQAGPVTVKVSARKNGLTIAPSRRVGKRGAEKIIRDVRHMFRLDDDLREFYRAMSTEPEFAWIAKEGAGRLLRSPTVFEDLVKMICTTNCSWALTEKMVGGLVDELGRESNDGRKTFPDAQAMARQPVSFYRDRVRAGYRAPYLKELAQRVASGELNVESWIGNRDRGSSLSVRQGAGRRGSSPTVREGVLSANEKTTDDLLKEMKTIKGVGNYAAENLLKLIGRYDGLALDSWTRAQFARTHNHGRVASDKKILRFYSRFSSWRGLALWCDMTRHWLDPENIAKW